MNRSLEPHFSFSEKAFLETVFQAMCCILHSAPVFDARLHVAVMQMYRDTVKQGKKGKRADEGRKEGERKRKEILKSITLCFRGTFIEIHQAHDFHRMSTGDCNDASRKRNSLAFFRWLSSIKRQRFSRDEERSWFANEMKEPKKERKYRRVSRATKFFRETGGHECNDLTPFEHESNISIQTS